MTFQLNTDGSADILGLPVPKRVRKVKTLRQSAAALGLTLVWQGTTLDKKWSNWHRSLRRG